MVFRAHSFDFDIFDVFESPGYEFSIFRIFEKIHLDFETIPDRIVAYSRETGNLSEISLLIAVEIPL